MPFIFSRIIVYVVYQLTTHLLVAVKVERVGLTDRARKKTVQRLPDRELLKKSVIVQPYLET